MGRKAKVSFEEKCKAMEDYLSNKKSVRELATKYQVALTSVRDWIYNYQSMGREGLLTARTNSSYSKELKLSAIEDYLSGKGHRTISVKNMQYVQE